MNISTKLLDAFKTNRVYDQDRDSTEKNIWDNPKKAVFVGKGLRQGENECGGGVISYTLFLAPKKAYPAIIEQEVYKLQNIQSVWRCRQSNDEKFFRNAAGPLNKLLFYVGRSLLQVKLLSWLE